MDRKKGFTHDRSRVMNTIVKPYNFISLCIPTSQFSSLPQFRCWNEKYNNNAMVVKRIGITFGVTQEFWCCAVEFDDKDKFKY